MSVTHDYFLGGKIVVAQPRHGFRAGVDSVMLAAAVPAQKGESVLDMGCGAGVALACLNARVGGLKLFGLEIQAELATLAAHNVPGAVIINHDITQKVGLREKFHHIMINPPFYMTQKNMPKKNASKKISNHMAEEDIALWVMAAKKLLRAKGYVTMIVPVSVSMLWIRHLAQCFGDIRLLPLWPHAGEAAKRVLLRARVGGMGPSVLLPGLVLHEADGRYTVGAQKILGEGAPIFESEADDA